jgi:phosphomannomutase / phosphoglucomutase
MSIYKACDIRGKFGAELKIDHASRLGYAISTLRAPGRILVAGDGRLSTPALKAALIDSLLARGWAVVDLGMVPTPLFYFARRHLEINFGVMVTASHNPAQDNGFKLTLGPLPVTVEEMRAIEHLMEAEDIPSAPGAGRGEYTQLNLLSAYLDSLTPHIPNLPGMRIVVDCANGVGGLTARQVWEKTGAAMIYLLEGRCYDLFA